MTRTVGGFPAGSFFSSRCQTALLHAKRLLVDDEIKCARGGIYTEKDIEEARRSILFPIRCERIIRQFVETVMQGYSSKANFELILGPDHYRKAAMNFIKRTWGRFAAIGNVMIAVIKLILAQCISTYALYKSVGFTWKLITGCLPFLAKFVLIENQRGQLKKLKKTINKQPPDVLKENESDRETEIRSERKDIKRKIVQ